MKKVFALAARELVDRRMVLITAAVLATLPFAALLIPEAVRFGTGRVIATTAAATASVYGFALVFLLGGSFVVRELTDKRMSFYFSKPLTGSTIWFGKLLGTWATILASVTIILLPTLIALGDRLLRSRGPIALLAVAMVGWFLVAHASSTMLRSRSSLVLLDAVAVVITWYVVYRIVRAFDAGHARTLVGLFLSTMLALLLIILLAAGAWQLSRGRIDARANHRELSRFLWSGMAVVLVIAAGVAMWVVSVDPGDLRTEQIRFDQPASSGAWVRLGGVTKNRGDYHAVFFRNVANGAHVRTDGRTLWTDGFFTPDGRVAGQLRTVRGEQNRELELVKFGERHAQVVPTKMEVEPNAALTISDDATRLAVLSGDTLVVQSLPRGDVLASGRLPFRPKSARFFFLDGNVVRAYAVGLEEMQIFELDVAAKKLTHTGGIKGRSVFNVNADATRMIVHELDRSTYVADARTGQRLDALPQANAVILRDGRVASVGAGDGAKALVIGSASIPLPQLAHVLSFTELSGNRLLVAGPADAKKNAPWVVHVVDASAGKVIRTERGLAPLVRNWFDFIGRDPRHFVRDANAPMLMKQGNDVVQWVPATGTRTTVISAL